MNYGEILSAMEETYRELAGFSPDAASDIGIRLKVLAEQVAALYERAETLAREVFPQTSTGRHLELHAETRGIARKPALSATGTLRFSRELPAPGDLPIEAGMLCATRPNPQILFETTEAGTLPAGETWVDIPARAVEGGTTGNVAPGSVCRMVSGASGITRVENPVPFSGGIEEEGDEALRTRLLESYRSISNGANSAFYYDLAMGREGVLSTAVLPRHRGRGTVDVVVHTGGNEATREELEQDLAARKEINVDVEVREAETLPADVSIEIAPEEGHSFALVAAACKSAAEGFLGALDIGRPLLTARLAAAVLAVDGVYNCRVLGGDLLPGRDRIIRPGTVTVAPMTGEV